MLENHDVTRIVTRFGAREARAAALLLLALPGPAFVYQGQELGLEEVDLPDEVAAGPDLQAVERSAQRPRRLPRADPVDARARSANAWLPQPAHWSELSVEAQTGDEHVDARALPARARAAAVRSASRGATRRQARLPSRATI